MAAAASCATDEDGDVIMTDANSETAPVEAATKEPAVSTDVEEGEAKDDDKPAEEAGPPPEEQVPRAEQLKEEGNEKLKAGDFAGAAEKYREGIAIMEPLMPPSKAKDLEEELRQRGAAAYTALCLNCAQACLKTNKWTETIEHTEKVLIHDKDNTKAMYRRGLASVQLDTEGRLEQAKDDFTRVATLDPANREVRTHLQKAKQRLQELRKVEKQKLAQAMQGGLYQEHHDKASKLQTAYDAEVKRREEAEEDKITYEDWLKKEKEKEEDEKKKQKEAREKEKTEAEESRRREHYDQEVERRKEAGEKELTFEEWEEELKRQAEGVRKSRIGGVMMQDTADLDEDERKMLDETKSKGYYHGRLGTVLSDEAPKPKQVEAGSLSSPETGKVGSEWNDAGTWEEKDMTAWVKERLTALLGLAVVTPAEVTLPEGQVATATAKVSKVKSISGDASVVSVRKKLKHGFVFEAELSFSISFKGKKDEEGKCQIDHRFSGSLNMPELMDAVPPTDIRMDTRWKGTPPSEELRPLVSDWLELLQESVRMQVIAFKEEYRQKR